MPLSANTRLKIGIAFAIGGNVLFFTSAWVAWMPWSAGVKAAVWGVLFFVPETFTLIGAAIMGKENFERFKKATFALLGKVKPAGNIGIWQHRIGLAMILLPLIPTYLQAYKPEWLPDQSAWRWIARLTTDLIFIAGLFVLGGDFWDKLHALFLREARAVLPPSPEATPPAQPPEAAPAAPESQP